MNTGKIENSNIGMIAFSLLMAFSLLLFVGLGIYLICRGNTPTNMSTIESNVVFGDTYFKVYRFKDCDEVHYVALSCNGSIAIK